MSNHKIKAYHEIEVGDRGHLQTIVGTTILKSSELTCAYNQMTLITFEDDEGNKTSMDYRSGETHGARFMVEDPLPTVPGTLIQIEEVSLVQAIDTVPVHIEFPTLAVRTNGGNWATVNGSPAIHLASREITKWHHVEIKVKS